MKETEDKPVVICPYDGCELEQETNGLIAWCEDAHVYELASQTTEGDLL